jgi:hypothetical protein
MLIWYKMSADIFRDRKVRTMTLEETGFWALCLALAKVGDGALPTVPEIAWEMRLDEGEVGRLVELLSEKGFLLALPGGGFMPNDWEDYQGPSTSTERMQKKRAKDSSKPVTSAVVTGVTGGASHGDGGSVTAFEDVTPREEKIKRRVREESARGLSLIQPEDRGPRPEPNPDLMAGFEAFIAAYPNQVQVDFAAQTWLSLADLGEIKPEMLPEIMAGLERWKISRQWESDGGKFIPSPPKFLRERLWRDNPPKGDSAKSQDRFPEWEPPKKKREPEVA